MKVSVIIPAYNEENIIAECLTSVIKALPIKKEIIVIDNNSKDKTRQIVKSFRNVRLLKEKKVGPAAVRNKGLRKVKAKVVLLVDGDVIVKKNTFLNLIKYLADDSVAGVGGVLQPYDRISTISLSQAPRFLGNSVFNAKIREVPHIPTALAAYKTEILKKEGWFDEGFYPSGEDVDLSYRIRKHGYKLLVNPKAKAYHSHLPSLGMITKTWFNYGIGWAILCKKHNKFELFLSVVWLLSLPILIFLSLMNLSFLPLFLIVFILPWLVYFSVPTLKYLIKYRDLRALLFPFIHQMQILARASGMVYGGIRKTD
jgi:GT2 family glycosyltransferase